MTKIYIDTNIFFNVWNEEVDPKSGKDTEDTELLINKDYIQTFGDK